MISRLLARLVLFTAPVFSAAPSSAPDQSSWKSLEDGGIVYHLPHEPIIFVSDSIDSKMVVIRLDMANMKFSIEGSYKSSGWLEILHSGIPHTPSALILRMEPNSPYKDLQFDWYLRRGGAIGFYIDDDRPIAKIRYGGKDVGGYVGDDGQFSKIRLGGEEVAIKFLAPATTELATRLFDIPGCRQIIANFIKDQ